MSLNPEVPMSRGDAQGLLFVFCAVVLGILLATVAMAFRSC